MKDTYKIIKYPLATEKAVRLMESENKSKRKKKSNKKCNISHNKQRFCKQKK